MNFYDYDGTVRYSYTATEFAALSALPANPTHAGLIAQGWNWTLSDAKTYVASYGKLNIGQMYITDDDKTRLYITIADTGRMTVPLYWSQTVANSVTIDWGDGTSTYSTSGTGNKNTTHTYSSIGSYVITLTVSGGTLGFGDGTSSYCVMGTITDANGIYRNMLKKVEIGKNVTSIGAYAFYKCSCLTSISLPDTVTSINTYSMHSCNALLSCVIPSGVQGIGTYAFYQDRALTTISIPKSVTTIGNYAFYGDLALSSVTIPPNVTAMTQYVFYGCHSLSYLLLPANISSIGTYAFYACDGVKEFHIKATTPPTLGGTSAFNMIANDAVIYVPSAKLSNYQSANNWSNSAIKSKLQGE